MVKYGSSGFTLDPIRRTQILKLLLVDTATNLFVQVQVIICSKNHEEYIKYILGKVKNLGVCKYRFLNPKTEAANCSYTVFCKPEIVQRQGQNV
jgi:hypothetical protein